MATKTLITKAAEKQEDGSLSSYVEIGTSFENVIDTRSTSNGYSLAQFLDSYLSFLQEADFIYYGENEPTNSKIRIWIDTSTKNSDEWE